MTGTSKCGHRWGWSDTEKKMEALKDHIERNIEKDLITECWKWIGPTCPQRKWGIFNCAAIRHRAQTVSYEVYCQPLSRGDTVYVSCDERSCCNPEHLFIGTNSDLRTHYMKVSDARMWDIDTQKILRIYDMVKMGYEEADIAREFSLPIGVIKRIMLRGKFTVKDDDGS